MHETKRMKVTLKILWKKLNNIDWFSWWKVCIQPKFIVYNDETGDGDTKRRIMLDRAGDKSKWECNFWLLAREKEKCLCYLKQKRVSTFQMTRVLLPSLLIYHSPVINKSKRVSMAYPLSHSLLWESTALVCHK